MAIGGVGIVDGDYWAIGIFEAANGSKWPYLGCRRPYADPMQKTLNGVCCDLKCLPIICKSEPIGPGCWWATWGVGDTGVGDFWLMGHFGGAHVDQNGSNRPCVVFPWSKRFHLPIIRTIERIGPSGAGHRGV